MIDEGEKGFLEMLLATQAPKTTFLLFMKLYNLFYSMPILPVSARSMYRGCCLALCSQKLDGRFVQVKAALEKHRE